MRTNLKVFRIKKQMTQEDMAEKLGYLRSTYAAIESGKRNGRLCFWIDFQSTFGVPDNEMWSLIQNDT